MTLLIDSRIFYRSSRSHERSLEYLAACLEEQQPHAGSGFETSSTFVGRFAVPPDLVTAEQPNLF